MTRHLEPEDLYAIASAEDPQVTPDGNRIAYVVATIDRGSYEYRRRLWIVPAQAGEPRQFTAGPNDTAPRWSPDGNWLAFVRAPAGEHNPKNEEERDRGVGKPQLWIMPADGGEARQLTYLREGAGDPLWVPDGSLIFSAEVGDADDAEAEDAPLKEKKIPAVRTIDRLWHRLDGHGWNYERRSHLFQVSPTGGDPRQLTDGDWDDGSPAVSPDGRQLAFVSDRSAERWQWPGGDIWVMELRPGATPRRLTDESLECRAPAWSPDGESISYLGSKRRHSDGHTDLYVTSAAADAKPVRLTGDFQATCEDSCIDDQRAHTASRLCWSADGKEIHFLASGRGTTDLYAEAASGGTPRRVSNFEGRVYAFSTDRDRATIALAVSTPSVPGDVHMLASGDGRTRRLTELNSALFKEVSLATPEAFAFRGADNWELQGWILRPHAQGSAPAILEIHGGPMAMYGQSFFFEFQLLAAQGYAVVYVNPRGSTGYGRHFSDAVNNDWGGKDWQDIQAGLDAAIARGGIDADRLGLAGGSYGGYMTNWAVSHSDRFKAAVTMRCVSNMAVMFGTSDLGWYLMDEFDGALPWKDLDRIMERSPITYVDQIHTPLLILHSDNDLRCPISEGEQMFTALKFLGREVRMMRFEGQTHDLSRNGHPRSRLIRLQAILDWFRSHIPASVGGASQVLTGAASGVRHTQG
jgi:dipeptidyl aminopeptidase/acylaminoacyl peptidase